MTPDDKINKFVNLLRQGAGSNLQSIILYGSAASGDFHSDFSNLNIFCILRDASFSSLAVLESATQWWHAQHQPPPLFMTQEELQRSTDVFTIEFMDMRLHHRVLYGEDVLEKLEIPMRFHRVQLEYELREKLLLLRQAVCVVANDERKSWDLLLRSLPSFLTLFRHSLMALGEHVPAHKIDVLQALSRRLGFNASAIETVISIREKKVERKGFRVTDIVAGYLLAVEQITAAVDKMLDARSSD